MQYLPTALTARLVGNNQPIIKKSQEQELKRSVLPVQELDLQYHVLYALETSPVSLMNHFLLL